MISRHRVLPAALLAAAATLATAVGPSSEASSTPTSGLAAGAAQTSSTPAKYQLASVCPSTIVVQTDWYPEADHSELYELAAPNGKVKTDNKWYTADLIAHGYNTGVKIQIRLGGPAIGDQLVSAELYEDTNILLGYIGTDQAIQLSASQPTVAVVAPRLESALEIEWSAAQHPTVKDIADLGKQNIKVLYYNGAPYMAYLIGKGVLKASQVDGSFDGTPSRWVASGGEIAQQGFATADPYQYQYTIKQWLKPIAFQLVSALGYNPYGDSLATLPANVTKYADCFKKLVPIIQQSQVDYVANPVPADTLIAKLVSEYNDGWAYTAAAAAFAAKAQVRDGIIANGPDGVMADFNLSRVNQLIKSLSPIYAKEGKTPKAGLTATDIVTNQFIDPSIHLPAGS
jgi:hypothetical protein